MSEKGLIAYIDYLTAELSEANLPYKTRMAWYQFRGQAYHELFTLTSDDENLKLAAANYISAIECHFPFLNELLLDSQKTSALFSYLDSKLILTVTERYIFFMMCVRQEKVGLASQHLLELSQSFFMGNIPACLGQEFFAAVSGKELCGVVLDAPLNPVLMADLKGLLISFITDRLKDAVVKQQALCQCLLRQTYLGSIVTSQQGMLKTSVASGSMHEVAGLLWLEFQTARQVDLDDTTKQTFLADKGLQKDLKAHHPELWRFLEIHGFIAHQVITDIFEKRVSNASSSHTVYAPDDDDYDPEVGSAPVTLGK